jgi:hypothetical protein
VIERRKQAVSIRMSATDVRKVKRLAQRIGVRDSDVIRFAVKSMLGRMGPLYDQDARGRSLVPVFVESGADLLRFFELDAVRLEAIINDGVEADKRVERSDIALLALAGGDEPYAALMLGELSHREGAAGGAGDVPGALRQYLYDKYIRRSHAAVSSDSEPVASNGRASTP